MVRPAGRVARKHHQIGYGMTNHRTPKLKTGEKAVARLKSKLREISRKGRGRNLTRIIEEFLKGDNLILARNLAAWLAVAPSNKPAR